jgi:hypothetical protein
MLPYAFQTSIVHRAREDVEIEFPQRRRQSAKKGGAAENRKARRAGFSSYPDSVQMLRENHNALPVRRIMPEAMHDCCLGAIRRSHIAAISSLWGAG